MILARLILIKKNENANKKRNTTIPHAKLYVVGIPHAKLYVVGRTDLYPSQSRVIGSMTNPIDREKFKKKLWKLAVSKKDTSKNPPKK
jgi:hypothetical protein